MKIRIPPPLRKFTGGAETAEVSAENLKELFEANPGHAPVRLRFLSTAGVTPLSLGSYSVSATGSLLGELRSLLGAGAARLESRSI